MLLLLFGIPRRGAELESLQPESCHDVVPSNIAVTAAVPLFSIPALHSSLGLSQASLGTHQRPCQYHTLQGYTVRVGSDVRSHGITSPALSPHLSHLTGQAIGDPDNTALTPRGPCVIRGGPACGVEERPRGFMLPYHELERSGLSGCTHYGGFGCIDAARPRLQSGRWAVERCENGRGPQVWEMWGVGTVLLLCCVFG